MKTCVACNAKLKYLGESSGAAIYQCSVCGLGVTGNGHAEDYVAYHRDPVYIKETAQFSNIFSKRVNIISRFKRSGKALEVGSSAGIFLSLLKSRGWEVQGVEPSKPAAKVALKRSIPTIVNTFEEANLKEKFDIVIFNHVLEHMNDPVKVLEKAGQVLRKGGLVFIDVPNFASLAARLKGVGWRYILPREHRWHFTPTSLFVLLEKAGFTPVYWEAHSGVWGYDRPLEELWQSLLGGKKRFFQNTITAIPTFMLTKLKAGTGLTVVAQKIK